MPGEIIKVKKDNFSKKRYYSLNYKSNKDMSPNSIKKIRHKLKESIKSRLNADVPVGIFSLVEINLIAIGKLCSCR